MEGLVEIHRSQMSLHSITSSTNNSEKSSSTLSLKKLFAKKQNGSRSSYNYLGSRAESINSYNTTSSKQTNMSQKNPNLAKSESALSTTSKISRWSYSTDRFSGPKHVPTPKTSSTPTKKSNKKVAPADYYKTKDYHDSFWAQAYAFGGR
eukprot:Seg255.2 transcript_id=Seg255.2/GoldUCD/mRNA.D3Y31 product="hypothetical protein" protein_id=Seg255.2/GoldUCD/D3Y31